MVVRTGRFSSTINPLKEVERDMDAGMGITNSKEDAVVETGVGRAFRHLDAVVAMISENVGRLEQRLIPVSVDRAIDRAMPTDIESADPKPAEVSAIAESIESKAEIIGSLANRLTEATYRLDI